MNSLRGPVDQRWQVVKAGGVTKAGGLPSWGDYEVVLQFSFYARLVAVKRSFTSFSLSFIAHEKRAFVVG